MAAKSFFQFKHITASSVVAGSNTAGQNTGGPQAILHTVCINNAAAAATIFIYDATVASDTTTPIALITIGAAAVAAGFQQFDCMVNKGISIVITGTVDLTVIYA